MQIETERIIITEFDLSMAESVHRNSLDEDNRHFLPDEVFETVGQARETLEFLIQAYDSSCGPFVYPVLLKDGTHIGHVQLVSSGNEYEVGYHIGKKYTGKGYATEALRTFLDVIMPEKQKEKVYGVCLKENIASEKVLERTGFSKIYEGQDKSDCENVYAVE